MSTAEAPTHLRENPLELARQQLRRVGETFAIDPNLINVLEKCKKSVEVSIPVTMDDGSVGVFRGYRVTHNIARGPSKGGIRYHPAVTPRRGQVARDVDDLEVRADGPAVRRRQGRRRLRPEAALARRARAPDAPLHERDHQRDRPREGHPRARRRHRRERDGLDLRHLLDEQGPLRPRRRHRQAARDRRLARPRGGDRARRALRDRRRARRGGQAASTGCASSCRASATSAATSRGCCTSRAPS